ASTAAVAVAVARSELPERVVRFALAPATVATLAMVGMLAAMVAWGLAVHADAPRLFNGDDGIVGSSTAASFFSQVALMAVATLVAVVACVRGLRVRAAARMRVASRRWASVDVGPSPADLAPGEGWASVGKRRVDDGDASTGPGAAHHADDGARRARSH
ncbi:MAG: hypothetical protein IVW57_03600, partial [Ktedonobacterales bacterium]|nr:hypothetical protein [Ktedonobacterales bacterium]